MTALRRYRVVDAFNQGIDKLAVQIDPIENYFAEAFIAVGVDGSPIGTAASPLYAQDADNWTQQLEYDGTGNLIYHGKALPGTPTAQAAWQIKQFSYLGSNITAVQFANGTADFTAVWDDRATYTYS